MTGLYIALASLASLAGYIWWASGKLAEDASQADADWRASIRQRQQTGNDADLSEGRGFVHFGEDQ